jgi:hypothetical protein
VVCSTVKLSLGQPRVARFEFARGLKVGTNDDDLHRVPRVILVSMEFIQTEQLYGARVFLEVLRRVTVEVYEGGQSPHPIQENRILGSIDRHLLKRTATARCDARWYGTARRIVKCGYRCVC